MRDACTLLDFRLSLCTLCFISLYCFVSIRLALMYCSRDKDAATLTSSHASGESAYERNIRKASGSTRSGVQKDQSRSRKTPIHPLNLEDGWRTYEEGGTECNLLHEAVVWIPQMAVSGYHSREQDRDRQPVGYNYTPGPGGAQVRDRSGTSQAFNQ